jgi:shikimate kinase
MGTGKTTIGRIIAARLGWQFADTDALIEQRQGKSIRDIFAQDGEEAFRQLETELCRELVDWQEHAIATGGGIVLRAENRALLQRAGLVVCLEAPAEEIYRRLQHATNRPLLQADDPQQRIRDLLAERAEAYGALPLHIGTIGMRPGETASMIIRLWHERKKRRTAQGDRP